MQPEGAVNNEVDKFLKKFQLKIFYSPVFFFIFYYKCVKYAINKVYYKFNVIRLYKIFVRVGSNEF